MTLPARMKFGIFLAPFHRVGENPTYGFERNLELIQWLDKLGFDEAWIGEHHSAGWETIASPEIFIATAAERTRHIKLGTGVISLPYHHPLMVANRIVQLDHLTRGRTLFGVGPGALVTDAVMLGIETTQLRPMMDESLDVIMRLMTDPTPLTYDGGWFKLREAILHLRPFTYPHPPLAVGSSESPYGPLAAGRHGGGILSFAVLGGLRGQVDLKKMWALAEEEADKHGKTMKREDWRLVVPVHLAETREDALNQIRVGAARQTYEYTGAALGRMPAFTGPREDFAEHQMKAGNWIVGTPDDLVAAIHRFEDATDGFGGLMLQANEWATREEVLKSYELLARYVMPRFQGSLVGIEASYNRCVAHSSELFAARNAALEKAHQTHEQKAEATV
jgi:limonene 1,2-monooxygenase